MTTVNDPKHWRERAAQMLALVEQTSDPQAKQTMLRIARDYEELAIRAENRAHGSPHST